MSEYTGDAVTLLRILRKHGEETGPATTTVNRVVLLAAADALAASQAETLELRRENTALRAYAQKAGCPYGHSPGGKCELGFPGCACADDTAVYFETYGDGMAERREKLLAELREERDTLRQRVTASANGMDTLTARIEATTKEIEDTRVELGSPSESLTTPEGARVITRALEAAYDRIAELEQEREDVRRVEDGMASDRVDGIAYDLSGGARTFIAYRVGTRYESDEPVAQGDSLAALGRMLKGVADAPLSSSQQAQNTEGGNG